MSADDRSGESPGDAGRRALARLELGIRGRADDDDPEDPTRGSPIGDEATEGELWNRIGRILRERDPVSYRQLRTLAVSLAALLDAPVEN